MSAQVHISDRDLLRRTREGDVNGELDVVFCWLARITQGLEFDADRSVMREQRSLAEGLRRTLLPSCVAGFLPFALLWLPGAHWRLVPLIAAAVLAIAIAVVALFAVWERLPSWTTCALAWAYLMVVVLLRASGGPSGVAAMVLLPVFWLALFGTRMQLWWLLLGVGSVFVVPLILVGGTNYPPSAWRAGILFITLSGIVGTTVQALVRRVRAQEREHKRLLAELDQLAHTDPLTGLANRRAWQLELDRGLARARRTRKPVSVALIDVDSFKAVNDVQGHSGGDSLLMEMAQNWTKMLRPDDVLARVGGDEFAVLIPDCSYPEIPELIRRLCLGMPTPHSCSIGVATWDTLEISDLLMRRADQALYQAKRDRQSEPPVTTTDHLQLSPDRRHRQTAPAHA